MAVDLLDRTVHGVRLRAVATERGDGDMHPIRVPAAELDARQRASMGRTWTMLDQRHTTVTVDIDEHRDDGTDFGVASGTIGDVIATGAADRDAVGIWAADCAPLLLFSSSGGVVGVHAGWRGLAGGVVDVGVAAIERHGAVVAAVLGPVIHPGCYEFGRADLAAVAAGVHSHPSAVEGRTADGAIALDVPAAVRAALAHHDLSLDVAGPCTACDTRWYSHRRRAEPGRHAVVGWAEAAATAAAAATSEVA